MKHTAFKLQTEFMRCTFGESRWNYIVIQVSEESKEAIYYL